MGVLKHYNPKEMLSHFQEFKYSAAVAHGDLLFCSGVIGLMPDGTMSPDPETQFTRAFELLGQVLSEAGADYSDIIEMLTLHFALNKHAPTFMKVRDRYLKPPYPAWTATSVAEVAGGALVEIKVTARLSR